MEYYNSVPVKKPSNILEKFIKRKKWSINIRLLDYYSDIKKGPTEIWTRIIGFRVQGANHYTIGPVLKNTLTLSIYACSNKYYFAT